MVILELQIIKRRKIKKKTIKKKHQFHFDLPLIIILVVVFVLLRIIKNDSIII